MAYTFLEVLQHAEVGNPIKVTKVASNSDIVIEIGGRSIQLTEKHVTKTVSNGVITETTVANSSLDLGTLFTAKNVLDSYSLKKAITDGHVICEAGTQSLSREPVISNATFSCSSSSPSSCSSCSSSSCSCSSCSCSCSSCSSSSCSCSSCSSSHSSCSSSSCSCSSCSCSSSSCSSSSSSG